jgi:hypothetical protein
MLVLILAFFALSWALWFTYLLRYPARWRARIDRLHEFLRRYGLSSEWMQQREKSGALTILVGLTTFITLMCLAVLMTHPHALDWLSN